MPGIERIAGPAVDGQPQMVGRGDLQVDPAKILQRSVGREFHADLPVAQRGGQQRGDEPGHIVRRQVGPERSRQRGLRLHLQKTASGLQVGRKA